MIIIDAHEDLAWNALTFGRDYSRSVQEARAAERGSDTPKRNGDCMIGWPEWVQGRVGLVFATLFAAPARRRKGGWDVLCYEDSQAAHRHYRAQIRAYADMQEAHPDKFKLIADRADLESALAAWSVSSDPARGDPVGLVLLMEGADGVRQPAEVGEWHSAGVRLLGPAWTATRYAGGTGQPGPFSREGLELLEAMAELNMGLDLSHLAEQAVQQALDRYPGPILASHSNARSLLGGNPELDRHLSDEMIVRIAERDGVIGVVLFNFFLSGDWRPGDSRQAVTLDKVADHINHICQLTGSADHVGIGSDFDGGFGLQGVPWGLDSVADLGLIGEALCARGYRSEDIEAILGGNWLRVLRRTLE